MSGTLTQSEPVRIGALPLSLCGDEIDQKIQLSIEYPPRRAFGSRSPQSARPKAVSIVRNSFQEITNRLIITAKRVVVRMPINAPVEPLPIAGSKP
jgi:hypothetical protein